MVGGAVGRHRMMQTRTSLVFAKDSGKKKKTPLLHSLCSAVLVCLDSTRFVRDGMTSDAGLYGGVRWRGMAPRHKERNMLGGSSYFPYVSHGFEVVCSVIRF